MKYKIDDKRVKDAMREFVSAEREYRSNKFYGLEHKPTLEKEAMQNIFLRRKLKAMRKHLKQMEKAIKWRNDVIETLLKDINIEK